VKRTILYSPFVFVVLCELSLKKIILKSCYIHLWIFFPINVRSKLEVSIKIYIMHDVF